MCSIVKDVQSMEAVSRSLNDGIVSLCNICKSLRSAQVNPTTNMYSNYKEIRMHIENAEQCLKTSETMIKEKLGYLDERMENLIREEQNAEQKKKEKNRAMKEFLIKKNSAEESLKYSEAALDQARKNVELANHAITIHQDRMNTYDDVATAGMVLLAIPIFGWVAGPIMMSVGEKEMEDALNAIRAAEWDRQSYDSQVRIYTEKVSYYQKIISRTQKEIKETNEALKMIKQETERVQKYLKDTGDIQGMVRKAMNLLSVLRGRVTVLERQTQCFIRWEPVVRVMEDVIKAVVNIAKNRLLYSQGVPGLIDTLRENVGELLALCNSPSNSEYDDYY